MEEFFGWQVIDKALEFIAKQLEELAEMTLTEQDILAIDRAAYDYLANPFEQDDLIIRVQRLLEKVKPE